MIDPAVLWVGGNGAARAADIGLHDFAVVAARDDDGLAHSRRQDRAAMDRDALRLAARRRQDHGFFAEHEDRHAAEKMRGDDGTARRNRMNAVDDGSCIVAGVGHGDAAVSRLSKSFVLSTRMRQPPDTMFAVPASIGSVAAHDGVQNVNSISPCGSNATWRDQADP
jgi:hypothetical protein